MMNMKKMIAMLAAMAVSAVPFAAMSSLSAGAADAVGYAELVGQCGTLSYWGEDSSDGAVGVTPQKAEITENGTYTVSWTVDADGTGTEEFLIVSIKPLGAADTFTKDTFEELAITVDSIKIDGEEADWTPNDAALNYKYYEGGTGSTRIYLADGWNINKGETLGIAQDLLTSIEVTFTISGLYEDGGEEPGSEEPAAALGDVNGDGEVNAADASELLIAAAAIGAGDDSLLTEELLAVGDINKDGIVNASDAAAILQYAAELGAGNADAVITDFA